MTYHYQKKYFPEDVLVYIEEFDRINGTVFFDFIDSTEFELFLLISRIEGNILQPSMIKLNNYFGRRIQEDTVYSVKRETIISWFNDDLIRRNQDSFLIGFEIEITQDDLQIFERSVSFSWFDDLTFSRHMYGAGKVDSVFKDHKGNISINVRNAEQGNWNEVLFSDEIQLVYDAGAPTNATRSDVISIIGNRNKIYPLTKPILILSHWDKDHYHSLIAMSDKEIADNFSGFVCRDQLPNLTSRILFGRIRTALGLSNLYCLAAEVKDKTLPFFQNVTPTNRQIVLYNSQDHKNRNLSGLVLTVKSSSGSVIFSGDSHYSHISNSILIHLNYKHNHHLVVPHHGGKAGQYIYNVQPLMNVGMAIISVGTNRFGHPMKYYRDFLKITGFTVLQTRTAGDVSFIL